MDNPTAATLNWDRIRSVFDAAIERPESERATYLSEMCAEPAFRNAVESLLLAWEQAGDFMETRASLTPFKDESCRSTGRRLGAYQITGEIGGGGMGTVYRATRADDQYEKAVAIKLVRSGFSSGLLHSRFRAERQILATLEHPNIARLLDGGTEGGCPYLVMELIEGEPIDRYCDRLCLSVQDRLKLFRTVCSALLYAHQHLIVHRDIKPSNILVTQEGIPKLLDFGIAKLVTGDQPADEAETRSMLMLTPEYASPEQVKGETVTTASDVYSLGILLFVLLTGRHPYSQGLSSPHQVMKAVCEAEPLRPSSAVLRRTANINPEQLSSVREGPPEKLRRKLAGDLDNIILKALCKEPSRRYESVDQFSEDIRRHLEGLPVKARESTLRYRTLKFLGRNKKGVALGALMLFTLLAGLAVTIREARIANRRFNDVRAIASSDLFEVHDALEKIPGSASVRHMLVQRALKYLDKLNGENLADPTLLADIATGYEKVARLQGNFSAAGIGDSRASLLSYAKSIAIRASLADRFGALEQLEPEAQALHKYSRTLVLSGKTRDALTAARQELTVAERISANKPGNPQARAAEAEAHMSLASVLGGSGSSPSLRDIPAAIGEGERAIAIWTEIAKANPGAKAQRSLHGAKLAYSEHLSKARRFPEALKLWAALTSFDILSAGSEYAGKVHNRFGLLLERMGDQQAALAEYRKTLAIGTAQLKADPNDVGARTSLQVAMGHIGMQETRLGIKGTGTAPLDAAVRGLEQAWLADPSQTVYANLLLIGYAYQAEAFSLRGDQPDSVERYSKSLVTAERLAREDGADLESRLSAAKLHFALAVVRLKMGEPGEAQQQFTRTLEIAGKILQLRPGDAETVYLADETRRDQRALQTCAGDSVCARQLRFSLPTLIN